jgi:hypothetical protein
MILDGRFGRPGVTHMPATRSRSGSSRALLAFVSLLTVGVSAGFGQTTAPAAAPPLSLTDAEMERFLSEAKVIKTKTTSKGVTASTQATLTDGTLTHDAHIQIVDEAKREFRTSAGLEFDFRDSWSFNVAAYKLDRLIGLNMVPVSVARTHRGNRAAVTWWVDHVMMDEEGRLKKKLEPPTEKRRYWYEQIYMMRIFDQLIHNNDRNLGNMLISKDWRLWPIDHTRAFRKNLTLRSPGSVSRCERTVFVRLKELTFDVLKRELGPYLDDAQIKAVLARRDLIVTKLEASGPDVLFERTPSRMPD